MHALRRLVLVAFVLFPGILFAQTADQEVVSVVDAPDPVVPGQNLTYTVTLRNNGPDPATNGGLNINLGGSLTHQSTIAPAGFTCFYAGSNGSCTNPSFTAGSTVVFTIVVQVDPALVSFPDGTLTSTFFPSGVTPDPNNANNSKNANTTYDSPQIDIALTASDSPDPVAPDGDITYTINVVNNGPDAATNGILNVILNNTLRYRSITTPAGWSCSPPAVDGGTSFSCTAATVVPGPTATFTLVLRAYDEVFGINDGTISQFFGASATGNDTNNANASVTVQTQYVTPDADISISASDSPDPVAPDGDITYTVTVTNNGPDTATGATLNVPLNNTLRFQSITVPAGWSCTPPAVGAGTSFSCTNPGFAAGSSVFTIVLRANDEQFGLTDQTIVQPFSATSSISDPNNANNGINVSTSYDAPDADLAVTLTDNPDPFIPGSDLTYGITMTNNGPSPAANAQLTVVLNPSLLFESLTAPAGFSCTTPAVGTNGTITCTNLSMASGAVANFTLVTQALPPIDSGGAIIQSVTVSSTIADPQPGNNTAGQETAYLITGQVFVFHLDGTQEVPPVPTTARGGCMGIFDAGSSQLAVTCVHDLATSTVMHIHRGAPGVNGPIVFDFGLPDSPVSAVWSGMTPADVADLLGGNFYVNIHSAGFPAGQIRGQILPRTVDLVPFTADGAQVVPPDATSATANCTADLNNAASAIAVNCTHNLPSPDLAQLHQGAAGTNGPVIYTFSSPSSPISETPALNVQQVAAFAGGFLYLEIYDTSVATIRGQIGMAALPPSADLVVTKSTIATNAPHGGSLTYTIAATNNGPDGATAVVLTDVLPASLLFQSITAPAGFTCTTPPAGTNGTITCNGASLANGATATFTLTVTVAPSASGTITNSATATSAVTDPTPADATATTAPLPVIDSADLGITKTAGTASAPVGSTFSYTITISNAGPDAATSVVMTDTLPAGLLFESIVPAAGFTCPSVPAVGTNGTITCNAATLASGASAPFTLTVRVSPTATGSVVNTASVSAATFDPNAGNGSGAAAGVAVTDSADLAITKTAGSGTASTGSNVTYTIVVRNDGPSIATNVVVTDVLSASLALVSATPSQGTCSGTTTVTCSAGTLAVGQSATITLIARVLAANGAQIPNTASAAATEPDPDQADNSAPAANIVVSAGANIPTLSEWMLMMLAAMLGLAAVWKVR